MTKTELLGFISKYALGGNVESVIWNSSDSTISTDFVSVDKTLKGTVKILKSNLQDGQIGIYNTTQLVRMLSVLNDSITTTITKQSLLVSDGSTNFNFVLADTDVIPKAPKLKMTPTFTATIKLDSDFINKFIKSYGALPENNFFTVQGDAMGSEIIFGYSNTNTNTISYNISVETDKDIQPIHFSSPLMREILVANKNIPGTLEISPVGLARVKFNSAEYSAEYLLVNKQID